MSEADLENAFIAELVKNGWTYNDTIKTEDDLYTHWRERLNKQNTSHLAGNPLTDTEFDRAVTAIKQLRTPFDAHRFLVNEKSIDIDRDNGEKLTLTLFYPDDVAGGNSVYEVVNQVTFSHLPIKAAQNRRVDVLLLVNGLPLGHFELKYVRTSNQWEAFTQLTKYADEGMYTGLMNFVQIGGFLSKESSHYFARPKDYDSYNPAYVFDWRDAQGTQVTNMLAFTQQVLVPEAFHRLVTSYIISDDSSESIMVMRSYQIHATRQILQKVKHMRETGLIEQKGGYIWHTTGSGKTITSFKVAQLIASQSGIDDVIFVVDRIDLVNQTYRNFKHYAESVFEDRILLPNGSFNFKEMIRKAHSRANVYVMTVQALNAAVCSRSKPFRSDKRIVVIMDEAHRSSNGEMVSRIREAMPNSTWFGFTGTPQFYNDEGMKVSLSTGDVFGPQLHRYTIRDAIYDKNVLGFSITYMTPDISVDTVLDQTPAKAAKVEEHMEQTKLDDTLYELPGYRRAVVDDIGSNWASYADQAMNKPPYRKERFSAMLAVKGKAAVLAYYNLFKSLYPNLRVAMTYSLDHNVNDSNAVHLTHSLREAIAEYQDMFATAGNILGNEDGYERAYLENLTQRLGRKAPVYQGDDDRLDLVIVSDQLLTGFDSKYVNTMYLDKALSGGTLIQAISRANRTLDPVLKEHANVRFYRDEARMKDAVNKALTVYTIGGADTYADVDEDDVAADEALLHDTGVLAESSEEVIKRVNTNLTKMRKLAGAELTQPIASEADQKKYVTMADEVDDDLSSLASRGIRWQNRDDIDLDPDTEINMMTLRNDMYQKLPPEVQETVGAASYNISFHEADTQIINYDTLTRLVQEYQTDPTTDAETRLVNWASQQNQIVQVFVKKIVDGVFKSVLSYDTIQKELAKVQTELDMADLDKWAHKWGMTGEELLPVVTAWNHSESTLDGQPSEVQETMLGLKEKHGLRTSRYRNFKQAVKELMLSRFE